MKKQTQKQKVLSMLQLAGDAGVTNSTFYANYLPRYGARIYDLRRDGYAILTKRDGRGKFTLTLIGQAGDE